jgi:hypothetical protein
MENPDDTGQAFSPLLFWQKCKQCHYLLLLLVGGVKPFPSEHELQNSAKSVQEMQFLSTFPQR